VLPVDRDGPGTVELVDLAQEHLVNQTNDASCEGRRVKGEDDSMVVAPRSIIVGGAEAVSVAQANRVTTQALETREEQTYTGRGIEQHSAPS
jgi:hypothetical protein